MNTNKPSAADLKSRVSQHIADLAQLTSEAARSQAFKEFLETCAKFYNYSWNNQFLIAIQNPNATRVAGYKRWLTMNRYVRRGEKGIAILAPCLVKRDKEDENSPRDLVGFRIAYVFDISQTDGEPLPEIEWRSKARQAELEAALIRFARSKGIQVEVKQQSRGTQGVSKNGSIELDPDAGTKTLIHEIAHELLHWDGEKVSRETAELEAEAVAYVVASYFEIPDLASPNYLALWDADAEKIAARADRIRQAASEIISAILPNGKDAP